MCRRQARLRREYIHTKGAQAKEAATADRKRKVKEAIESGKALPTELRKEADALRAEIELDDASRGTDAANNIDSEYSNAGVSDPKVCVSWSNTDPGAAPQALQHPSLSLRLSHRSCSRRLTIRARSSPSS